MGKLHIIIKTKYFNQILNGDKTKEYRIVKPYWVNKLVGKKYSSIIFQAGYSKTAERMEIEYLGYEIENIKHEFFGNDEISVFAIKLGNIIVK
jgi:hypothetical protein